MGQLFVHPISYSVSSSASFTRCPTAEQGACPAGGTLLRDSLLYVLGGSLGTLWRGGTGGPSRGGEGKGIFLPVGVSGGEEVKGAGAELRDEEEEEGKKAWDKTSQRERPCGGGRRCRGELSGSRGGSKGGLSGGDEDSEE